MKKLLAGLAALVCMSCAPVFAQTTISRTFNIDLAHTTGPAASPWIQEKGTGVKSHTIVWTILGAVSTCSVKVEKSADGVTWSDMISGATCTSASSTGTATTDIANFVRVNATTFTGSGTLIVTYFGFSPGASLSATIDTTGLATSANQTAVVYVEDAASAGGESLILGGGVRRDTAASSAGTDGDYATFGFNSVGGLWVANTTVDAADNAAVATSPVPIGGVFVTSPTSLDSGDVGYPLLDADHRFTVNVGKINGVTPLMGAGNTGTGSPRVTIASDQAAVPVTATTVIPAITGGWSSVNATAADGATACTNSAQAIKASQGVFGGYFINNPNTADEWVHIYNVAFGSVTVGTTNPTLTFRIPGAAANSVGANLEIAQGIQFGTAMSFSCTSTAGGNGAPSTALEADFWYR